MKSRDEIEDYLEQHKIYLTHGRIDAIYSLYQDGWGEGWEECEKADKPVTSKDLSEKLNGIKYGGITQEHTDLAHQNGLVIVYGASDDLMGFAGAISHEAGAWEGTTVRVNKFGVLNSVCEMECTKNCRDFDYDCKSAKTIKAIWGSKGISWTYETDIPHETFDIMDGEEIYCRGIVFSIEDVKKWNTQNL